MLSHSENAVRGKDKAGSRVRIRPTRTTWFFASSASGMSEVMMLRAQALNKIGKRLGACASELMVASGRLPKRAPGASWVLVCTYLVAFF